MAHAQKPDLVFQRNGRVHLNRRGCQFSRLLAAEECGSADSNCIDRVPTYSGRLLPTHSIRIFLLHFPARASPCAIRFQTRYTGSFPGVKSGRGVTLTPHLLLVTWLRKSRAIPLLPLCTERPVQSLSVCTRGHFTFCLPFEDFSNS